MSFCGFECKECLKKLPEGATPEEWREKVGFETIVGFLDGSAVQTCTRDRSHEKRYPDYRKYKVVTRCQQPTSPTSWRNRPCWNCKEQNCEDATKSFTRYFIVDPHSIKPIDERGWSRVIEPEQQYHRHSGFRTHPIEIKHKKSEERPFYTYEEWVTAGKPLRR